MYNLHDTVTVTVDRPMGSTHPTYPNLIYPLNYGYVEGVPAPDGEEQDAYILGVDIPLPHFTGELIAILRRIDDCEEKWVVAPAGARFSAWEILAAVHFQEHFFHTTVITE